MAYVDINRPLRLNDDEEESNKGTLNLSTGEGAFVSGTPDESPGTGGTQQQGGDADLFDLDKVLAANTNPNFGSILAPVNATGYSAKQGIANAESRFDQQAGPDNLFDDEKDVLGGA